MKITSEYVIIAAIIIVLMLMFKFKEIRHKASLIFMAGILVFLFLSFMQVYTSSDVDLKSFDGVSKVTKLYFSWLGYKRHTVIYLDCPRLETNIN